MPTTKHRLNVTLDPDTEKALRQAAARDHVPEARKAADLLNFALELEEDLIWANVVKERDTPGVKYISHDKAWETALKLRASKTRA